MKQEKLYIITHKKGYVGHPNWRITPTIESASVFADLFFAQEVAKRTDGTVRELVVGKEIKQTKKNISKIS